MRSSEMGLELALEFDWLAKKHKDDLIVALLVNIYILCCVHSSTRCRSLSIFSCDIGLLELATSPAGGLDHRV